jgi:hypothetical protein
MSNQPDGPTGTALARLLEQHGFNADTRLYRETMRESMGPSDTPGVFLLTANPDPGESIVDVYGQGYVMQAAQAGPGLAFAESAQPDWQDTMEMRTLRAGEKTREVLRVDRVEVEVRLGDILAQGGLIYPVESVAVEKAWYCTLPSGTIRVRVVMF